MNEIIKDEPFDLNQDQRKKQIFTIDEEEMSSIHET